VRYLLSLKKLYVRLNKMSALSSNPPPKIVDEAESESDEEKPAPVAGRRRRHRTMRLPKGKAFKAKTLKRVLKKAGLKTTGKKSTLRARARKAHLIRGGGVAETASPLGGRRR